MTIIYSTAQAAFQDAVGRVSTRGRQVAPIRDSSSVGSHFGQRSRTSRELLGDAFTLSDPRARIISSTARPIDLPFAVANAVWTLSGSNELEMIAFYNQRGRSFSEDGCTLAGAVGHRIFASAAGNQVSAVLDRLASDPTSRRTVLQVLNPADMIVPPLDTPCSIAFEYLLREKRLSSITFMRSQSVIGVLPYDLFLFTMLQESLAVALGVETGEYHHISGSLHYYEDESHLVTSICSEERTSSGPMPRMSKAYMGRGNKMSLAEAEVRSHLQHDPTITIDAEAYELDRYWTQLLRVLIAGGRRKMGVPSPAWELELIDDPYRSLLLA